MPGRVVLCQRRQGIQEPIPFRNGPVFLEAFARWVVRLSQLFLKWLRQHAAFKRLTSVAQSPLVSAGALLLAFLTVSLASRGYQATRWMLKMPYPDSSRLVLLSETGVLMGQQVAVSPDLFEFWRSRVTTLTGIASYRWDGEKNGYATAGLFELLGGLPQGFVPREIRSWRPVTQGDRGPFGVIGRLKPGVTITGAQAELRKLEAVYRQHRERYPFPKADVASLVSRMRQPFIIFGLICGLAILAPLIALVAGIVVEVRRGSRIRLRYWIYFAINAVLFPLTLLVAVCEFTPVTSVGVWRSSFAGEPLLAWLTIVVCTCWIRWCLVDQYRRCRVCLKRLRLPVTVGILGAIVLDTAGTELACAEGHGALYLPEESSDYVVDRGWSDLLS